MALTIQVKGKCCDNTPLKKVLYDCGDNTEQTLLICDEHFKDECFSRFAKRIVELKR